MVRESEFWKMDLVDHLYNLQSDTMREFEASDDSPCQAMSVFCCKFYHVCVLFLKGPLCRI